MASEDPKQQLRKLYREGLRECGFLEVDVERGLGMLESDRYFGFADVVSSLKIMSHTVQRPHRVDWIVQSVSAAEARVAAEMSRTRAATKAAEARVDAEDDRARKLAEAQAQVSELRALLAEMTPLELDGKVPLRPHIASALKEATGYGGEFRVGQRRAPRPSWEGRAPAPKAPAAAVTKESGKKPLPIRENEVEPEGAAELVKFFRAMGLSEDAAQAAAAHRLRG